MFSAQEIKNFIPQNDKINAPRRIDVKPPTFEQAITSYNHGFPLPKDINGGLKYETCALDNMRRAGASINAYDSMYPCIPQSSSNRILRPDPVANSNGFQAPYGYARGQPAGIASIKKRDALFAKKTPLNMSTNTQLAPMMPLKAF